MSPCAQSCCCSIPGDPPWVRLGMCQELGSWGSRQHDGMEPVVWIPLPPSSSWQCPIHEGAVGPGPCLDGLGHFVSHLEHSVAPGLGSACLPLLSKTSRRCAISPPMREGPGSLPAAHRRPVHSGLQLDPTPSHPPSPLPYLTSKPRASRC